MSNAFVEVRDPVLGETVLTARTAQGLRLRVAPTDRFRDVCAVVQFGYGSADLGFVRADGVRHASPEGVAHYLEHKLFEDEDLHVFERFGARGARVNAMTGFARTIYYFQASTEVRANLVDLLRLVSRAHLTDENVEKERGIIAQELRMNEDRPEQRILFELLRALYRDHPIRNPVGGTVASIQGIDVAELRACFDAFYRCGNASLAVAGAVDPLEVLELASAATMPDGDAPERLCPDGLEQAGGPVRRSQMDVVRPRVMVGFKERTRIDDVGARLARELATRVLLDRCFGGASEIRERLHDTGLVDDTLTYGYLGDRNFGVALAGCETEQPDAVAGMLRDALAMPVPFGAEDLERVRRKLLGQYVRSFDAIQGMAFAHAEEELAGIAPFGAIARMQAITVDDVVARQAELCGEDAFGMAIVER